MEKECEDPLEDVHAKIGNRKCCQLLCKRIKLSDLIWGLCPYLIDHRGKYAGIDHESIGDIGDIGEPEDEYDLQTAMTYTVRD